MKSLTKDQIHVLIKKESRSLLYKGFFLGIILMSGTWILSVSAFTVDTSFESAIQYIKSIFVTDTGKPTGNLMVAMNTGGKALQVYGSTSLVGDVSISGTLNASLNELDPKVGTLQNGKYCTASGTQIICTTNDKIGSGTNGSLCTYNTTTSKIDCITTNNWKEDGEDIYYKGGNVGIGTDNPQAFLDVGTGWFMGNLFRVGHPNGGADRFTVHAGGDTYVGGWLGIGTPYMAGGAGLHVDGDSYLMGNVGIDTETPSAKLDVAGNAIIQGTLTANGNVTVDGNTTTQGTLTANGNAVIGNNIEIGTNTITGRVFTVNDGSNGAQLFLQGTGGAHAAINFSTLLGWGDAPYKYIRSIGMGNNKSLNFNLYKEDGSFNDWINAITINSGGNVGIGTGSPQAALDVNGGIRIKIETGGVPGVGCSANNEGEIRYCRSCGGSPGLLMCDGTYRVTNF